jgi:lipid-binding SYLF domain-containing protein
MHGRRYYRSLAWTLCLALLATLWLPGVSRAATAREIDAAVDSALSRFAGDVQGGRQFLQDAKGVLVIPGVIQAGFGVGGQYGEGALRIHNRTAGYYSLASGSVGFQFGAQKKDIILVFLQQQALQDFQNKVQSGKGWQVGVDGSVVLINLGAHAAISSATYNQPIVGFVIGQQGLMYNLTLQGTKISKLYPKG